LQGRSFYENCVDVLAALDRAEASVDSKGAKPRGRLRITAPLGFGRRGVAPMAPRFQAAHTELDIRAGTKGNAEQQSTHRTQTRARVTQALSRVRQFAVTHPR
jgi:DNA-binding transcriptional LysR family regulator